MRTDFTSTFIEFPVELLLSFRRVVGKCSLLSTYALCIVAVMAEETTYAVRPYCCFVDANSHSIGILVQRNGILSDSLIPISSTMMTHACHGTRLLS